MRFNDIKKTLTESKEQLEKRLYELESAVRSARGITKQIKYADTHLDVIRELENLAEEVGIELDDYDVRKVYQANNDLESACYELESAFEEAKRDVQMDLDELDLEMDESSNDSYYAYHNAAKKWSEDTGKPEKDFAYAGVNVQDEYIEPEMKKYGLVPDSYQGKGVTKYRRESLEALARHVKEGVPLIDSLFRYQSEAYFDTFKQAKQLREMGSLPELDWESEEMLGTDIGESVALKGIGTVWLDVPYLDESDDYEMTTCDYCHGNEWDPDGPQDDDDHDDCPKCAGTGEIPKDDLGGSLTSEMAEMKRLAGINESNPKREKAAKMLHDLVEPDLDNFSSRDELESYMSDNMPEFYRGRDTDKAIEDAIELLSPNHKIPEAEYNGKKVQLNKPKRGGSKKYYVYVKNPKTGRVKKISFGDPGLKTKSGNKKRAKSFAARHNCEKKNDKMKAGYWACRLPRYGLVKGGKWW